MTRDQISSSEYNPYFGQYINKIPLDVALLDALSSQATDVTIYFNDLNQKQLNTSLEQGKWTPKEVLQHLIDSERIFSYRALRFARNDSTELTGFNQDIFVKNARIVDQTIEYLLEDYKAARQATITLYKGFDDKTLKSMGKASGNAISVRALGFLIAGHEKHHLELLTEKFNN